MSSRVWDDNSLTEKANAMSCDAMITLARNEYQKNANAFARQFRQPADIDASVLSSMLSRNGSLSSRNLCFEHDPSQKAGEYFTQFEDTRKERFEQWTRVKNISPAKNYHPPEMPPDLDTTYFNCHIPSDLMCLYEKNDRRICPPKCGIHPTPCPTPIR